MDHYLEVCEKASKSQGIDVIVEALKKLGIESEIDQTGGFCMVGRVQVNKNRAWEPSEWASNECAGCFQPLRDCLCDANDYPYLGFTAESVNLYRDEDSEGTEIMAEFFYEFDENNDIIEVQADKIARTIETILFHYQATEDNSSAYVCLECGDEDFALEQGRIIVHSETFVEFYCLDCVALHENKTSVGVGFIRGSHN